MEKRCDNLRGDRSHPFPGDGSCAVNFDYFMKVRHERLAYFQDWLRRKFRVGAPLDGEGILAPKLG